MDLHAIIYTSEVGFYTDSSAAETLGFGGVCGKAWFWGKWE